MDIISIVIIIIKIINTPFPFYETEQNNYVPSVLYFLSEI